MLGMSPFGLFHTLLGVVALVSGFGTLLREGEISTRTALGRVYVFVTPVVAATGLTLFHRGGFGVPHAVAILTLVAIAIGFAAEKTALFGRASRYVMTFAYSATVLFHLMPTFAEGLSRLPPRAPLATSPDDPLVKACIATLNLLFLVGVTLQLRRVRRSQAAQD